MIVLILVASVLLAVALAYFTGWLMYRLAPHAGWTSEQQRQDWQAFGRNWGWIPIGLLAVLVYFAIEMVGYRMRGATTQRP